MTAPPPDGASPGTYGALCLDFPLNNGGEAGFASPHVNRESVTEEIVVRELLQNALDASSNGSPVRAEIRHERVRTQDLPLIKEYMEVFNAARAHRHDKGVNSPAERQAIDRIRDCLQHKSRSTDVLACTDSGNGIDTAALRSLYNTGDTTKHTGRGSVGLGHLTAFAASDLRYVLYAGRDAAGAETFGGHAILATSNINGEQRDAHGYIRGAQELRGTPASQACGSTHVLPLVRGWLPTGGASGSVAAILGYGYRRTDGASIEDRVLEAAAKSFVVAVHQGHLSVVCTTGGKRASLGADDLARVLSRVQQQQRRRQGRGVRGCDAWAAYQTLRHGALVSVGTGLPGVSVWMRALPAGERSLVCIFREGMWITSDAAHLRRTDFADLTPFCAVVNVEEPPTHAGTSVCKLVREAEGETHSQIRPSEITDNDKRRRLHEALREIAATLREHGVSSASRAFEPEQLRIFHGRQLTPTVSPPLRRLDDPPPVDDASDEVADIVVAGDDAGGEDKGQGGGKGDDKGGGQGSGGGPSLRRVSARGDTSGIRVASRHLGGRRWGVVWRAGKVSAGGLRVVAVLPSGTDETTERQIGDAVLGMASVTTAGRNTLADAAGQVFLPHAGAAGEADIEMAEAVADTDAALVKIRLMHVKDPDG